MSIADEIAKRIENSIRTGHRTDAQEALNTISKLLGENIESSFLLSVNELVSGYEEHMLLAEEKSHQAATARQDEDNEDPIFAHLNGVAERDKLDKARLEKEFPGMTREEILKQSNEAWIKSTLVRFGELVNANRRIAGFPKPEGLSRAKYCAKLDSLGHRIDPKTLEKIEKGEPVGTKQFLNAIRGNPNTLSAFLGVFIDCGFFDQYFYETKVGTLVVPDNEKVLAFLATICKGTAADVAKRLGKKKRMAHDYKRGCCNPNIDVWLRLWSNGIGECAVPDWHYVATRREMLDRAIPTSPLNHENYVRSIAEANIRQLYDNFFYGGGDYDEPLEARMFFIKLLMPEKVEKFEAALGVQFSVMQ